MKRLYIFAIVALLIFALVAWFVFAQPLAACIVWAVGVAAFLVWYGDHVLGSRIQRVVTALAWPFVVCWLAWKRWGAPPQ